MVRTIPPIRYFFLLSSLIGKDGSGTNIIVVVNKSLANREKINHREANIFQVNKADDCMIDWTTSN